VIYFLNKIVGCLASPLGVALALMALAGVSLVGGRFRRASAGLLVAAFAWLWFWGMPLTTRFVGVRLERPYCVDSAVPERSTADAIVVLGGGMDAAPLLGNYGEMHAGADRVWLGARLWKAQNASRDPVPRASSPAVRLIATGTGCRASTAALLADLGVPTGSVTFVEGPRNTEEEARQVARLGVTNVLLVTSAWHMDRARLMFAKYAPKLVVTPAAADFDNSVYASHGIGLVDFFPQAEALRRNSSTFREYVGLLGYWFFR